MKKLLLLSALFALVATGCTKQDDNNGWRQGTVQFEFSVNSLTRAGIYSQEDIVPNITSVQVHAYLNDGTDYVYAKSINIPGWTDGMIYVLEGANILTPGDYKFLAVGQVAGSHYSVNVSTVAPNNTFDSVTAFLGDAANAGDLYAGSATTPITTAGGRVAIDMTRKVSGILLYLANIPAQVNGQTVGSLRLTVQNASQRINLSTGELGVPVSTPYDLITFDFTGQTPVGGVYPGNPAIPNVVQLPNTYLDGSFINPVSTPLSLALWNVDGTTALHTWQINNGAAVNIEANNLYKIGRKVQAGNTNGGTGDDPTPTPDDDDQAFDLSNTQQQLVVTVSTEWNDIIDLM